MVLIVIIIGRKTKIQVS